MASTSVDPRDQIWVACYNTLYEAMYAETIADKLINRWQKVDETVKVLVALTASGSTLSGFASRAKPEFQTLWLTISTIAATLAIIHSALGVAERIKDRAEVKRRFVSLRTDLETFRYQMRINPEFEVADFGGRLLQYRKRYGDTVQLVKNDIILTSKLARKAQAEVNQRLADEMEQEKKA